MPVAYGKLYIKDSNGAISQIIPEAYSINTEYVGATSSANGTAGLVPPALSAQKDKFLRGDGSWAEISLPATYTGATSSSAGVAGLVPAAAIAEKDCFLCGDGTWDAISGMTNAQIDTAMANVGYVGDIDPSLLTSITNSEIDALFA